MVPQGSMALSVANVVTDNVTPTQWVPGAAHVNSKSLSKTLELYFQIGYVCGAGEIF